MRLLKQEHWRGDMNVADLLDYKFESEKAMQPRLVRWSFPDYGWVKLNSDRASKGNPGDSGAGGILRDQDGTVMVAFSKFLGEKTNVYAELLAIMRGL
ncbi:UNVERIFIED_CONTAM: putative ribonuclease H protein [Sesamum latifolium]|uniref:Ribonuclease H protein n=1 Tax=Sesamum latifolium TaxID=2727402 RepID=A0AAW2TLY2_9LAMI